jgi:hypothetical protein
MTEQKNFCGCPVNVWPEVHILIGAFSPACAHDYPHLHGKICCLYLRQTAVWHLNPDVPDGDSYELAQG